ncbi:MAG: ABC transporter permease [Anaerolineae bacterium]
MISELLTPVVILGIIASGIRLATPYLFAGIGETFGQLSGVLNLGVEGIMLLAAFAAFYVTIQTGSLFLGLLVAMLVGGLLGLMMAFISVTLKAEQGISGIGLYVFGLGMSDLLFNSTLKTIQTINGIPPLYIPGLSDLPVLGSTLFSQNILTYLAFALVPLAWFIINKTTLGMQIVAVGQNPAAADALGINVARIRYLTVITGGVFSGLAGASLSIALLNVFQQNLTSGIGFIAVALVYFGAWRPVGVMLGSLLFSMVNSLQLWVQTLGIEIPSDVAVMMPYVLTILALAVHQTRPQQAGGLTKHFTRGG